MGEQVTSKDLLWFIPLALGVILGVILIGYLFGAFEEDTEPPTFDEYHPCEVFKIVTDRLPEDLLGAIVVGAVDPNPQTDAVSESMAACWRRIP